MSWCGRWEPIVFSRTLRISKTRNTRVVAGLRPRSYSEAQAGIGARHQHWRRGVCARMSPFLNLGFVGGGKPESEPAYDDRISNYLRHRSNPLTLSHTRRVLVRIDSILYLSLSARDCVTFVICIWRRQGSHGKNQRRHNTFTSEDSGTLMVAANS